MVKYDWIHDLILAQSFALCQAEHNVITKKTFRESANRPDLKPAPTAVSRAESIPRCGKILAQDGNIH
jgi:hypothetical protein